MTDTLLARTGPEGIPAMSGSVPGSADVTVMRLADDVLIPVGTETSLNISSSPVRGDAYIAMARTREGWVVDVEMT